MSSYNRASKKAEAWQKNRFNPCFSGCRVTTVSDDFQNVPVEDCFNPCFSGCRVTTNEFKQVYKEKGISFQSLF